MVTPVSIRFRRAEVADRLKAEAGARNVSTSALAEELVATAALADGVTDRAGRVIAAIREEITQ